MRLLSTVILSLLSFLFFLAQVYDVALPSFLPFALCSLLSLLSLHLTLRLLITSELHHVSLIFIYILVLTLDKIYGHRDTVSLYLTIATTFHLLGFLAVLVSIPFSNKQNLAHAQDNESDNQHGE